MMKGNSRHVYAREGKRGLHRATIGALVATHFRIHPHGVEGIECTLDFGNVLDEDGSFIDVTLEGLSRAEVTEKLGPFLREGKYIGSIAPGVAVPWPALLKLVGGNFSIGGVKTPSRSVMRRIEAVSEALDFSAPEICELLWQPQMRIQSDRMLVAFFRNFLDAKAGVKDTAGPSDDTPENSLARYSANSLPSASTIECSDPHCALIELHQFYSYNSERKPGEPAYKVDFNLSRDLNEALNADRVPEDVWNVIKAVNPDLCFEAVLSKLRSTIDATLYREVLEEMKSSKEEATEEETPRLPDEEVEAHADGR